MENFLQSKPFDNGVPAAFFQHFLADKRYGKMAVDEQLDYFNKTDMDVIKIMFDNIYPKIEFMNSPEKWAKMPSFSVDNPVFHHQLEVTKEVVNKAGKDAYIMHTLFSPFVSAGNATTPIMRWDSLVTEHLDAQPEHLASAMGKIAYVLIDFAKSLTATGIDGFYVSIQAGEYSRFEENFFNKWLKPYDVMLLNGLKETGKDVFVHLCGANLRMDSYYDYPGDAFNMSFSENEITPDQALEHFKRPIMGGIDNKGIIVNGTKEEIQNSCKKVLETNHNGLMLGADCTIPDFVPWENLKWAVEAAHSFQL